MTQNGCPVWMPGATLPCPQTSQGCFTGSSPALPGPCAARRDPQLRVPGCQFSIPRALPLPGWFPVFPTKSVEVSEVFLFYVHAWFAFDVVVEAGWLVVPESSLQVTWKIPAVGCGRQSDSTVVFYAGLFIFRWFLVLWDVKETKQGFHFVKLSEIYV